MGDEIQERLSVRAFVQGGPAVRRQDVRAELFDLRSDVVEALGP